MNCLRKLPDGELESSLLKSTKSEREFTSEVVGHLSEVFRRRLYLKRGYSSLYQYAVKKLKYSEASSFRRTSAARLGLEVPSTFEKISNGELSLCAATDAWKAFRLNINFSKNSQVNSARNLPGNSPGNSAGNSPGNLPAGSLEKTPSYQPTFLKNGKTQKFEFRTHSETSNPPRRLTQVDKRDIIESLSNKTKTEAKLILSEKCGFSAEYLGYRPAGQIVPITKNTSGFRVVFTKDLEIKYYQIKNLLSHKIKDGSPVKILDRLMDDGLEKYDPVRRDRRIKARKSSQKSPIKETKPSIANNRRQPWYKYDKGCAYIDPESKKRCGSKRYLDVDHIKPRSKGGEDIPENFQLLCSQHNRVWKKARDPTINH